MMALAASRIRWYSLSVSVWAGATVIESPVWTPIGSKFSIEQMMTTLSALSRITSSSNSFQPMTDSSIEHLVDGAEVEAAGDELVELLAVVGDAAAGAAHGEARPQHARQADLLADRPGPRPAMRATPLLGTSTPILSIASLNFCAVLGLVDDVGVGADHLDAVLLQDAVLVQVHRGVQAGLAAERGQQGVGPFLLDDLLDDLPGDRLDVGAVGRLRVGHDGGRVGVDQDDLVALLAEGLARLGAGVVELARLADDDGAGADEQDLLEVGAARHGVVESLGVG